MSPTRRSLLRATGAAGLAGLAGCTDVFGGGEATTETPTKSVTPVDPPSSSTASPTPSGPTPQESATLAMACHDGGGESYVVNPSLVWVEPGTTVLWGTTGVCRQRSLAYHPDNDVPLRIPEDAAGWASPFLQGDGATFEHTFEQPGVYNFLGIHEVDGQVGIVVVGRPDLESEPGMTEPSDELPEAARAELRRLIDEVRTLLES